MKKSNLYTALLLLGVLHHDYWYWNDPTLVFGIMPIGLAYHAAYSVVAGVLWALVMKYAWPSEVEEFARPEREGTFRE